MIKSGCQVESAAGDMGRTGEGCDSHAAVVADCVAPGPGAGEPRGTGDGGLGDDEVRCWCAAREGMKPSQLTIGQRALDRPSGRALNRSGTGCWVRTCGAGHDRPCWSQASKPAKDYANSCG